MNDEDMALMYLTDNECKSTARDLHQHQEIEMLFENYLLQVTLAPVSLALYPSCRQHEEIDTLHVFGELPWTEAAVRDRFISHPK